MEKYKIKMEEIKDKDYVLQVGKTKFSKEQLEVIHKVIEFNKQELLQDIIEKAEYLNEDSYLIDYIRGLKNEK